MPAELESDRSVRSRNSQISSTKKQIRANACCQTIFVNSTYPGSLPVSQKLPASSFPLGNVSKPRKLSTKNVTLFAPLKARPLKTPTSLAPEFFLLKPLCKIVYPKPAAPVSHVIACASNKGSICAGRKPLIRLVSSRKWKSLWFILYVGVVLYKSCEMMTNLVNGRIRNRSVGVMDWE